MQLPGLRRHLQGGCGIQPKLPRRAHRVRRRGRGSGCRRHAAGGVGLVDPHAAVVGRGLEAELGVGSAAAFLVPSDLGPLGEDPRRHQRHPRRVAGREHLHLHRQLQHLIHLKQCTKLLLIYIYMMLNVSCMCVRLLQVYVLDHVRLYEAHK